MVEWPEGMPEAVRAAIERVNPKNIKSVQAEKDAAGKVQKVTVRREGMTTMVEGPGSTDPSYNTTVTYDVEYDGEAASKMHFSTEYDGSAGYNAKMDDPEAEGTIEL